MPDISFITPAGDVVGFEAPEGVSLMRAATGFGIDGIIAECGGQARCATCHVIVDEAWVDRLAPPSDEENEMLEFTAVPRQPCSRLSCQIRLTAELQGLVVQLPELQ
ncbi:2Fe-2S iron-sulfur cluster-binding protein [Piscinibacter sakaiensis]|uniref:2Fe-2S iron-sulfur cluster-binding protein n=1 Tax=Piscinibacter sakaiensis TaxID=1547922 RepID=UPI003AAE66D4